MKTLNLLAFDLGASSGRAILGRFNGERLALEEMHRFDNDPVTMGGHLYWDLPRLHHEIKQGLVRAKLEGITPDGIGIDTWGVDFGLLDGGGALMANPYHYRDTLTDGMQELAFSILPREEIYSLTGIAFMKFNTLFQLLALSRQKPWLLENAQDLLFMPDLLAYLLCGEKSTEFTVASTGQVLDASTKGWALPMLDTMGIPTHYLGSIVMPGGRRGVLSGEIAQETGLGRIPLYNVATHDTASAVAAVPVVEGDAAYLSSGTWSLMGVEVDQPVINEAMLENNFTNEGGFGGRYRLLKNIMGLWIIQEIQRAWQREGIDYSFGRMMEIARGCKPFLCFIHPDDELFYAPGNMPAKVQQYCHKTGQTVPQSHGEIIRCVYESLALRYRWAFHTLEEILGKRLDALHIVGGGTQNALLNRFTADAINRPVICGPVEATAIGNIMVQAIAAGEVADMRQARRIIRDSFPTEDYMPQSPQAWDEAYARYSQLPGAAQ